MNKKVRQFKKLLIFNFLLVFFLGCQEFIHDSFDTFQGVIVNKAGDPIPNLRLRFYFESSQVYSFLTGSQGEFRVVLPSKNFDSFYNLEVPQPFLFELNQFDMVFLDRSLTLDPSARDVNGVIDLGNITLVEQ